MARTKYEQRGKTVSIRFTSRSSVKVGDNYYTVEACEERMIPDIAGVNIEKEKELLWDSVNAECDRQIDDIWKEIKKSREKRIKK